MIKCELCDSCNKDTRWICRKEGNFYSTGEYANTVDFFGIFGVSFKQKVDSVKHELDPNTIQILKVLLTDYQAPAELDLKTSLDVVATLDFIQSRLSNDNNTAFNSIPKKGDDE